MEESIEFSLLNKHKYAIFSESQKIKHFPTFHFKATVANLIPVLSFHYIWDHSSEWLLIPKNIKGYRSLLSLSSGSKDFQEGFSEVIRILLSGDYQSAPWGSEPFFKANSDSPEGVYVRENLFLNKSDYNFWVLASSIKNQSNFLTEIELNNHQKNSFLIQPDELSSPSIKTWKTNLVKILKNCEKYSLEIKNLPNNYSNKELITNFCKDRLEEHISNFSIDKKSEYIARLESELSIFNKKDYWNYLFIFYELMLFLTKENILTSSGRGSACSSLVIFLLGITQVDPVEYDLLFDRFLNISSDRMPDLDLDVEASRKEEILNFLSKRFGENSFVIPSIIKRIKNLNLISADLDKIGLLDDWRKTPLTQKLIGLPYLSQPHPSSLIPLTCPSQLDLLSTETIPTSIFPITPFEYGIISYLNLQKFDILSSPYLDLVSSSLIQIKNQYSQELSLSNIDLTDQKTYNMIGNFLTYYLFHLDSEPIKRVLQKFKPKSISELAQLISIIRPGINKHISKFLNYDSSKTSADLNEDIKKILSETRGIILYQEQIMKIISAVTGLPLFKTDKYRLALQKKKLEQLNQLKIEFFQLSVEKGYSKKKVEELWAFLLSFGEYTFNKSHAIAYALSAYKSAFLKANFSSVFYIEIIKKEGITERVLIEISNMGFHLVLPHFPNALTLYGHFDDQTKKFYAGLNLLKTNPEVILLKLQKLELSLKNQTTLKELLFFLLSNGFSKEEIMQLNYINWFQDLFTDSQNQLYLRYNWDFILGEMVFNEVAHEKEIKTFSLQQQQEFYREQKESLNIDLKKHNWING